MATIREINLHARSLRHMFETRMNIVTTINVTSLGTEFTNSSRGKIMRYDSQVFQHIMHTFGAPLFTAHLGLQMVVRASRGLRPAPFEA